MTIPLTQEQQQALDAEPEEPLRFVDPRTLRNYVLLPAELYERLQTDGVLPSPCCESEVAPGIRRSKEAFLRDLPALMANPKLDRWWVAYHGGERIGLARKKQDLIKECLRRGLSNTEYYLGIIRPHLPEPEEIERFHPYEFEDIEPES
jgi:hypothetical protein